MNDRDNDAAPQREPGVEQYPDAAHLPEPDAPTRRLGDTATEDPNRADDTD